VGVVSRDDALSEARRAGLDLVLIAPDADPPVVKVMDYGKHLFELKKTKAAQKKKQKQTQLKEMKFRPGTEEADYQVKLRNLKRFLEDGDKAKVTLRFRGREMVHQDIGLDLLMRVKEDLTELGAVETGRCKDPSAKQAFQVGHRTPRNHRHGAAGAVRERRELCPQPVRHDNGVGRGSDVDQRPVDIEEEGEAFSPARHGEARAVAADGERFGTAEGQGLDPRLGLRV